MMKKSLFIGVSIFLLSVAGGAEAMYASDLIHKSCGFSSVGDATSWTLDESGFLGTYVVLSSADTLSFSVLASGVSSGTDYPVMDVHLGGEKWSYAVSGANQTFTESGISLNPGIYSLRIEFTRGADDFSRRLTVHSCEVLDGSGSGSLIQNVDSEANALASADSYIKHWRNGSFNVALKYTHGQAVEAGKKVRVQLKRHAFNFGMAVHQQLSSTSMDEQWIQYREHLTEAPMFSMLGMANGAKWKQNEPSQDYEDYTRVTDVLKICSTNDFNFRWHAMSWGAYNDPSWVKSLQQDSLRYIHVSGISGPAGIAGDYQYKGLAFYGQTYLKEAADGNPAYLIYRWYDKSLNDCRYVIIKKKDSSAARIYFMAQDHAADVFDVSGWTASNGATGAPIFTQKNDNELKRQELRDELTERIDQIATFADRPVTEIDGDNEMFHVAGYLAAFGLDEWSNFHAQLYDKAKAVAEQNGRAAPIIVMNDYEQFRKRRRWDYQRQFSGNPLDYYINWFRREVEAFQNHAGTNSVGGMGLQAHHNEAWIGNAALPAGKWIRYEHMKKVLDTYSVLGIPIAITESSFLIDYDGRAMPDEEAYETMNGKLRIVFGTEHATTFCYWNMDTDSTWLGFYDKNAQGDWEITPIGQAWKDLVAKEWATDIEVTVGSGGQIVVPNAYFGKYQISGKDGFSYHAEAVLEKGTPTLSVVGSTANTAPVVDIYYPSTPLTTRLGQNTKFIGSGSDPEDGTLGLSSLVWSSSIDGEIGTGAIFPIAKLSEGTHTITLTTTDSGNLTHTDTITHTVLPPDVDGDGMADEWEFYYFGGTNTARGAGNADWDNDGVSNLSEYIAGTSPIDSSQQSKLSIFNSNATLQVEYRANSATGNLYLQKQRYYEMYTTTGLTNAWNIVPGHTNVLGNDLLHSHTEGNPDAQRFFQLKVRLQDE